MSVINPLAREITAKIVFYGPGMSGKTTSLQFIHRSMKPSHRGELISLATEGDRTLYFDFLPVHLGRVRDLDVRLQLYTVPGQVFYGATRQLVLEGADGVVFVADSQRSAQERNVESLRDLEANLRKMGTNLKKLPFVIQYNKRDLPELEEIDVLRKSLNEHGVPDFATCAAQGDGVLEALKMVTKLVTEYLSEQSPSERGHPSKRQPLTPSLQPSAESDGDLESQVTNQLETLGEAALLAPSAPEVDSPSLPSAPDLTDLGDSNPPASWDVTQRRPLSTPQAQKPASSPESAKPASGPGNNALTIQAPAATPLSFSALWDDSALVSKIEQDIATGHFAEAVYRATGGVSEILDTLLGPHAVDSSATRAQLLGLDGHEYLELRRLGSHPASTITQRDALFALYVLISAHIKESRLKR